MWGGAPQYNIMRNIKTFFNHETSISYESLSSNALWLLEQRYFIPRFDKGQIRKENSFSELARRVSRSLSAFETLYSTDIEWIRILEANMEADILEKRFLFNSPCLFNAGASLALDARYSDLVYKPRSEMSIEDYQAIVSAIRDNGNKNGQLFACFVIGVEDSLEGIFKSLGEAALISKWGGGVGISFGPLRESGASLKQGSGIASGPVSFMNLWNTMGETVVQGGKRRAALMGILPDDHQDILKFIDCKRTDGVLPYFNVSIAVSDQLMKEVEEGEIHTLYSRVDQAPKTIDAKNLFERIASAACLRGDPGVFFIDNAQNDNILKLDDKWSIRSTNPCGEQPLPDYTSCNLGSINVNAFVKFKADDRADEECFTDSFDYPGFAEQTVRSMYYLDLVIDATTFPIDSIKDRTNAIRPVGLGVMGVADAMIRLGMTYGDGLSRTFVWNMMNTLAGMSLYATCMLADVKGAFPEHCLVPELMKKALDEMRLADAPKNELASYLRSSVAWQDLFSQALSKGTIPPSLIRALDSATDILVNNAGIDKPTVFTDNDNALSLEDVNEENKAEAIDLARHVENGMMRNSRRLSIAPTGSISMLLDVSSGIEPNFRWNWSRDIISALGVKEKLEFWHPLIDKCFQKEIKEKGYISDPRFVLARDVAPQDHVTITALVSSFVDSGVSKTVTLPESADARIVQEIYKAAWKGKCKGITVYREGSRKDQPITDVQHNVSANENVSEKAAIIVSGARNRPDAILKGYTMKESTPWGSMYVTLDVDDQGPFEVFINIGKSGSEVRAMTEAIARVISIGLRSGCKIEDLANTLKGLGGKEAWMFGSDEERIATSIPDAIAYLLVKLHEASKENIAKTKDISTSKMAENDNKIESKTNRLKRTISSGPPCPECSSPMEIIAGCAYCFTCGYSPCK